MVYTTIFYLACCFTTAGSGVGTATASVYLSSDTVGFTSTGLMSVGLSSVTVSLVSVGLARLRVRVFEGIYSYII